MDSLEPDQHLANGRYRLLAPLGQGGMASVWRAWDERLSVERAVKLLSDRYRLSRSASVRFQREARLMAQLEHPHVVPVHDIGEEDGQVFLVMSLLDHSLQDEVDDVGQLPPGRVVRMAIGVLDALDAAHELGIVHRDVKPHNVLVDERDAPRLTDFGIATDPNAHGLTGTGAIMGTLAFMAPEQRASARRVDARADIYAVGAMIYALCTGEDSTELDHPEDRDERLGALPDLLMPFVERATRHRPHERFATAPHALAELRDLAVRLPDTPAPRRVRPRSKPASGHTFDLDELDNLEGHGTGHTLSPGPDAPTVARPSAQTAAHPGETELIQPSPSPPPAPSTGRWAAMGVVLLGATALALLGWGLPGGEPGPKSPQTTTAPRTAPSPSARKPPPEPTPEPSPAPVQPPTPAPSPAPAPPPAPAVTPARAAPPAPEPPDATFEVFVNSDPMGSPLRIDGGEAQSTPWSGRLPAGPHTVEFGQGDGAKRMRLTVEPSGDNRLCWDLSANQTCAR